MGRAVDINSDLGESFGAYTIGDDAAMMPIITSANVACGFHGGDPLVMERTVRLARAHGVGIGAHPGLPDLVGFGRRDMHLSPEELRTAHVYQIGALWALVGVAIVVFVILHLTGDPAAMAKVISEYRVYAKKVPDANGVDYSMDHTAVVYVMDKDGRFVNALNLEQSPQAAADEFKKDL